MTVCVNDSNMSDDDIYLDQAFSSVNNKHSFSPSMKYFETDVSDYMTKYKNNFSVGMLNINTIINKFHDIAFILNKQLLDILIINESKLNKNIDDSLFTTNHYDLIRRDRLTDGGGGVLIFIKKNIVRSKTEINFESSNEIINFIISLPENKKIGIIAAYRPPYTRNAVSFIEEVDVIVNKYDSLCDDIIVVGDLNFDCFDAEKSSKLTDFCAVNGFTNTITQGTRICPQTFQQSLIDVILCMITSFFISSMVFTYPNSDHKLTVSVFKYKSSKNKSQLIQTRALNPENLAKIKDKLTNHIPTVDHSLLKCPNSYWEAIKGDIVYCRDNTVPLKKYNVRPENKTPWYNKPLVKLNRIKDKLYKAALVTAKISEEWTIFKIAKAKFKKMLRNSRNEFFKKIVDDNATSTNKLWNCLNPYLNPNKR